MRNSARDVVFMLANLVAVLGGGYVGGLFGYQTAGFFAGALLVFVVFWVLRRRSAANERKEGQSQERTRE